MLSLIEEVKGFGLNEKVNDDGFNGGEAAFCWTRG